VKKIGGFWQLICTLQLYSYRIVLCAFSKFIRFRQIRRLAMFTNRSISRILFNFFNIALILTLLIGSATFPSSVRATGTYTLTDLGTLGGSTSSAVGINEAGQVIGSSVTAGGQQHAFIWGNGILTDLGTLGGNTSFVSDINDAGQVVGQSYTPGGQIHAFVWDSGTMTDLGTLGGNTSQPVAIIDTGQVIGQSQTAGGQQHAFVWDNGIMTDLGTLGGDNSRSLAINEAGQVVGLSDAAGGQQHAFLWDNGTMTDLGTLGGVFSYPEAINESGQVVGDSQISGDQHAFIWEDGVMSDLGTLGGSFISAKDINEAGQVIGASYLAGNIVGHAFIWDSGIMTDLGTLGGNHSHPVAINEAGQIVGWAHTAGGQQHAFVWESGIMTDLGTLGGSTSQPIAINEAGQVIGYSQTSGGLQHAFVWDSGIMTDLGTLGGNTSQPIAINEAGQIIGSSVTGSGQSHAFVATVTPTKIDQTITIITPAPVSAINGSNFTVAATASSGLPVTYSSSGSCTNIDADFTMTSGTGTCMVMYDQAGDSSYNPAPQITEAVAIIASVQSGPTFTVNTAADSNGTCESVPDDCSLREAINAANALAGTDTIVFDADYTITLGSQLPAITSLILINGTGAANTIVQANVAANTATYRVFQVNTTGNLTLDGLTVRHGRCAGGCAISSTNGGGIHNNGGTLIVTNSAVSANSATTFGGGIWNNGGILTVTNSTISGNSANSGGGILKTSGTITATNSTFSSNSASNSGGGIYNNSGTLTVTNNTISGNSASEGGGITNVSTLNVTNSTVSGNSTVFNGGGILNTSGTVSVTNSTVSGNSANGGNGGGLYTNGGTLTVTNSTVVGNSANFNGSGIFNAFAILHLKNTIVANSPIGVDCYNTGDTIATNTNNLIEINGASGHLCGTPALAADPNLGPLTGSPEYFSLNSGSPAIDAGDDTVCAAAPVNNTSQNGLTRPQGAHCDIGSYESDAPVSIDQTITVTTHAPASALNGSNFTVAASASSLLPVAYSSSGSCTNVGADFTMTSGTGTCTVMYDQTGDSSYNPAPQIVEVVNAQQAVLTVTADAQAKVYGSPDPTFRFTYSGFVNGDLPGVVDAPPVCTVPEAHVNVGMYRIICSGGSDDDYTFQYIDNELAVTPKSLTITADNQGKVFGTSLTFTGAEFTTGGLIFSDTVTSVTLNSAGAPASATVAGSPYPIIPSVAVGTGLNNYAITYVNGLLSVSPNILTITADDQIKTYGDVFTFAGTEFTVAGLQGSDTVTSVTLTSAGAPSVADVGTYPIMPSSAVGTGLGNYTIVYTNGQMDVNLRNLVVTPDDQTKIYGDVFTAFTGTITDIQPGDNITANYASTGAPATAAVGTYPIPVTLNDPGNVLSNYNVIINSGSLTITHRALVVTPDDKVKVYGDVFTAFTGAIMGLQAGDNITANYASAGASASATVGSYPITATLNDPDNKLNNYNVTLSTGTLTVDSAMLTATADDQSIVYGDLDPSFTFTYSGFLAADTSADIDTPPTCTVAGPHTDVGTYPIVCSGGFDNNYNFNYVDGTLTILSNVPDLLTPADDEQLLNNRPTFDWTVVSGALSYTIQISNNIGFTGTPTSNTVTASTFTQPTNLPNNVTRYWRVQATRAGGPGPWSEIRSFVTASAPSAPGLASPGNNALVTDYTPLLNWNNSSVPAGTTFQKYELQIATDSAFTSPTSVDVSGAVTNSDYTPGTDLDSNSTYYWRVRAFNTLGQYSAWSNVRNFRTALVPPTLVTPIEAEQMLVNRPTFEWDDVPGADDYRIQISNNVGFTSTLTNATVTSSTYTRTADLPFGATLYWRVRSDGVNGPSAWSEVRSLITTNPPSVPTLSSPGNNAKVSGPSPLFNWNDSTLPVGVVFDLYQIQVATSNAFTTIVHDNNVAGITNSQDNTAVLSPATTYYWRVRSFNTLGHASAWSTVRSVRIKFAGPTLTSPSDGVTVSDLIPTFTWDAVSGATDYTIQVSKDNTLNFSPLVFSRTATSPTYTHTANLQAGTTYYWRVRVRRPNTYGPGDWSEVFTFTTP
jgi:CSLREA domain-containing protein